SLAGASYANSGTTPSASFTLDDGPGDYAVYGRIMDKDGGFTDYTATVHVNDVAPTAVFSTPAAVDEGSAFTVALSNPFDPSSADTAAGFHYAFALDGGSLAAATYASSSSTPSATFTFNDAPSDHTVYGRI